MKKKIIFLSIFILIITIGGVAAFYFTRANQQPIVYGKGEVAKYKTDTRPAPTDGTTPIDHDSYDNIAYILWVLEHTDQYSSLTEGTAISVGQKQTIYNHRRVNGKEQLVDTISGGLVTLGKQKYFKDGKVLIRDFISKNENEILWKEDEPECISNSQYIIRYGWLPTQATAYIICKETILEISELTELGDGTYSISLSLNPDKDYAPFWYKREVATNASSLTEAKFSSIQIEFIFDKEWRIQEVNTKEKYNVTPKVAPIAVNCETNIHEKFTYEKPDLGPALDYFTQYKDLEPSDGADTPTVEENTPLSYITGSLLSGKEKEHLFKIHIALEDGMDLEGKLSLDISDLNDVKVKVSVGDLQIVYESKVVYIDFNQLKVKCNIEEASLVLQPLLEEILYGENASGVSPDFDINQIMNDINNAIVTETENTVRLDLALNLMGISMPLTFDIQKSGDELDLRGISSLLNIQNKEIKIDIVKQENIKFLPIEGEYNDLNQVDFLIKDITEILKNKRILITFDTQIEEYSLSGKAFIHTSLNQPIQLDLQIENPNKGISEKLTLYYVDSYFYVTYEENKVKLSLNDLIEFLNKKGISFSQSPNFDLKQAWNILSTLDFKTLLKGLTIEENAIKINLDLSMMDEHLKDLSISILDTEKGFDISIDPYHILFSFDTQAVFDTSFDQTDYVELKAYLDIMDYLSQMIGKKSFSVHMSGEISIENQSVPVDGILDFVLTNTSYTIEGSFTININGEQIKAKIIFNQNDLYLTLYDKTVKINWNTLSSTMEEIQKVLGFHLEESLGLDLSTLLEVLHSFRFESDKIELDLNQISQKIGKVVVSFLLNDPNLYLEIENQSVQMKLELSEIESKAIQLPSSYYTEEDILNLLKYVQDIKEILNQKHVGISGSLSYEGIGVAYELYVDFTTHIEAIGKLHISYKEEVFDIDVAYKDESIYISYNQIKVKLERKCIEGFLPQITLPNLNIEELLKNLQGPTIGEDWIELGIQDVVVHIAKTSQGFDIRVNQNEIELSVNKEIQKEIQIEEAAYTNIKGYVDLGKKLFDILGKESFGLDINGEIQIEDSPLSITGNLNFYYHSTYEIEGNLELTYQGKSIDVTILQKENKIYLSVLGYTIQLNLDTLADTIQKILKEFEIELPSFQLDLKTLIGFLSVLQVKENGIELDAEKLGLIGISYLVVEDQVLVEIKNKACNLTMNLKRIEEKEVQLPSSYYTEEDILNLLKYVQDIKEILNQKHVGISGSLSYEGIGVAYELYVDFTTHIEAIGKLHISYKEEVFDIDVAYKDESIYISYNQIKVKLERKCIEGFLPQITLPNLNIEELLKNLQGPTIGEDWIELGIQDVVVHIAKTSQGFDIRVNQNEIELSVNKEIQKEIQIEEAAYTNIKGYVDLGKKLFDILGKESFGLDINGEIQIEDSPLSITGTVDFILNEITYDIVAEFRIAYRNFKFEFEMGYVNHSVYLKIYDNVAVFDHSDLGELVNYISTKIFDGESQSHSNSVHMVKEILNKITLGEQFIKLDLSSYLDILSEIMIGFTVEDQITLSISSASLFELQFSQREAVVKKPVQYEATISKQDLYTLLDEVFYIVDVLKSKTLHLDIHDAILQLYHSNGADQLQVSGSIDVLLKNGFEFTGHLCVQGLGFVVDIDVLLKENMLYFTISNQTIGININELETLFLEAKQIIEPIYSFTINNAFKDIEIDFASLGILLEGTSITANLTELLNKACEMAILFHLTSNGLDGKIEGNYDKVSFTVPLTISKSILEELTAPSSYLGKEEILELLRCFVDAYSVMKNKEFNIHIFTSIYSNGTPIADINGDLHIKLLENNEFDARLTAMIQEYKNQEQVGWHQLDIEIISLSTLHTLGADFDTAMVFATYGNNAEDPSAVIKVKSTYTGIEALIESVVQLMKIDLPSVSLTEEANVLNFNHFFHSIRVENNSIFASIYASALFPTMIDEEQVMEFHLDRTGNQITGIHASNLYVSYTNVKKNLKLNQLDLEFTSKELSLDIPTDLENYYDISNASYLFEALYHNAMEKNFEITGQVTLQALSMINIKVPVDIKVNVDEQGKPIILAELDIPYVFAMLSEKKVQIYYKDDYVYINRIEKGISIRRVQIHYSTFMENIIYYLMDFGIGLPNKILDLIYNSEAKGDGFVDASQCVNEVVIGTDTFTLGMNMGEMIDNFNLGNLTATLQSQLVAKTDEGGAYVLDEEGNIIFVPMIYSIPNFKFSMVSVINLNSNNLVLSNIQKNDDSFFVVQKVALDELYDYIHEYEQMFQKDEEYIYSNGSWISNGKIKHTVIFELLDGMNMVKQYSEGDRLIFPYQNHSIVPLMINDQQRYYELVGWYLDDSYLKPVEDIDQLYMDNHNHSYFARLRDVTIEITVTSDFAEEATISYYEGFDFESYFQEMFNIHIEGQTLYQYMGLLDAEGNPISCNELKSGIYHFFTLYEEVSLDFYLKFKEEEYLLDPLDKEVFLKEDAILSNNGYFLYSNLVLTPEFIIKNFVNLFILNEEMQRLELRIYAKEDTIFETYDLIEFEVPKKELNNKNYYGYYIRRNVETDISNILPNGTYESFEINAWVSDSTSYLSLDDVKHIQGAHTLTCYPSTKQEYFEFEDMNGFASITSYTGTASTLIFPEYALLGSSYKKVTSIKEQTNDAKEKFSAFTGNTTIQTLILNESLSRIGSNAFKNCDGLVSVYFPIAMEASMIATDAFYFIKTGTMNFEKARDEAKEISFYCTELQKASLDLIACTYNGNHRHYGKKESGFLGAGTADLRNSYQVNETPLLEIIWNTFK